ncbi:phosphatidylglycerol/phosphatidylinositol transfer protein [Thecamonas trahens ATCC 50062]|uniref:Phosphatidylglycerol/phosphatidylinositol transfer protein n=1 Tax=Thecamonas trahens ATCC 50062 TaxID=461836 RepID=A0A0L0DK71_THETB|nr:phosphatidylglycerol/phosphatidylinositol transfer protein [Thecamonas trahens ATCC 50062]KNC52590.1 phosphatidylglycerol/phosphatidylinositol transfer protein [Thecamonas trahens ATCC 50062]|eukprot:XP_013755149.1 phosphatidylglycerol/phosphatidylinositol transfer protein [Thecamonas trahens ATCC 50062]
MKLFVVLVLVALAATAMASVPMCSSDPVPNSQGWCDCGASTDDAQIESVTISPSGGTVNKGSNVTLTVTASDTKTYPVDTGSTVTVQVKYGIITLLHHTYDLCTLLNDTPYKCPIAPFASKTLSISEMIPSEAPSGKYTGKATAVDQKNNEIACIEFAFSVQ